MEFRMYTVWVHSWLSDDWFQIKSIAQAREYAKVDIILYKRDPETGEVLCPF
jgi:hypothetical protein